jgi:hypothetical protein
MAVNPVISDLDWNQALKRTINPADDTLRVEMGASTGFAIELSEADGDSVATRSLLLESNAVVTTSATGVIVAEMNVEGYKQLQILANITSALTGTSALVLEISPVASGDVWIATSTTMTLTGSTDLLSAVDGNIARRARVSAGSSNISAGSATVYLMARG